MIGDSPTPSPDPPTPSRIPAPGERVRVSAGKLAGLMGSIFTCRDRSCTLLIDGWVEGAYLVIDVNSIEREGDAPHNPTH